MKFSFVTALALAAGVMSAAVPVSPAPAGLAVEKRQLESQGSVLDSLKQAVVAQTTQINATLDGAPEKPSTDEADALADDINPHFAAIADALKDAKASLQQRRRAVAARQEDDGGEDSCDAQCITEKVLDIVYEIASTVRAAIERLGLRPLLSQVNPLLLALSALVISLNVLVQGLLLTVSAVVTTLLGGLGLSLLLLGFL